MRTLRLLQKKILSSFSAGTSPSWVGMDIHILIQRYRFVDNYIYQLETKSFQTIFVPQLLDVPEIKSHFSGRSGFEKHFEEMLGNQTGKIFQEIERFPGKPTLRLYLHNNTSTNAGSTDLICRSARP